MRLPSLLFAGWVATALAGAGLAQATDHPSADALRAQIQTIAWLNGLDLSAADARAWAKELDGAGALLAATDAQENDPAVLAALDRLRAKVLKGDVLTDEDWELVDQARCRVVNARSLDEPAQRRQQALLPLTSKLVAALSKAQQLVLAEPDMLNMAWRLLGLIAAGQKDAGEEWKGQVKNVLNELKNSFGEHGAVVSKRVAELIEAGRALKPEQFAKDRATLRDDLLTALGLDYETKKLAEAGALGLGKAILDRPALATTLKLWADARR